MAETRQQKPRDAATVPRIVRLPVAVVSRDPNKRSFGRSLVERACLAGPVRVTCGRARAHRKRMWVSAAEFVRFVR